MEHPTEQSLEQPVEHHEAPVSSIDQSTLDQLIISAASALGKRHREEETEMVLDTGEIPKKLQMLEASLAQAEHEGLAGLVEQSLEKAEQQVEPITAEYVQCVPSEFVNFVDPQGYLPHLIKKEKQRVPNDEQSRARAWDEKLQELRAFKDANGHLNVPRYSPEFKSLCHWTRYQRERKQSGKLTPSQVQALEELGFQWMTVKDSWEENFEKLRKYQEQHNSCCVPYKIDKQLNIWVHTQRSANREGALSQDRKQKLDSLGFKWTMKDRELAQKDGVWQEHFEHLKKFKETHGHMNPTREVDRKLDRWVRKQRETYKSGLLSKERIQKLEEIGFQWSLRGARKSWEDYYSKLREFKDKNGHLNVTRRDDRSLHMWITSQRTKPNLRGDQIQKLEELGFQFQLSDEDVMKAEHMEQVGGVEQILIAHHHSMEAQMEHHHHHQVDHQMVDHQVVDHQHHQVVEHVGIPHPVHVELSSMSG